MVAKLFIWCIRAYQYFLSPLFPPACRFFPNCSTYAILAVERYGLWKGMGLALWRIVRCNPFHPGGVDLLD